MKGLSVKQVLYKDHDAVPGHMTVVLVCLSGCYSVDYTSLTHIGEVVSDDLELFLPLDHLLRSKGANWIDIIAAKYSYDGDCFFLLADGSYLSLTVEPSMAENGVVQGVHQLRLIDPEHADEAFRERFGSM